MENFQVKARQIAVHLTSNNKKVSQRFFNVFNPLLLTVSQYILLLLLSESYGRAS